MARAGGTLQRTVGTIAGDAARPLDRAALAAKFTHYAAHSVAGPKAAQFCDTALDAPADTALRALWQVLAA